MMFWSVGAVVAVLVVALVWWEALRELRAFEIDQVRQEEIRRQELDRFVTPACQRARVFRQGPIAHTRVRAIRRRTP